MNKNIRSEGLTNADIKFFFVLRMMLVDDDTLLKTAEIFESKHVRGWQILWTISLL
jgi:hypothetical protein